MTAARRLVVAAVIEHEGRILAAQRATPTELAGLWEFPGGKVEAGESAREALVREIREELGCEVRVGAEVPHPDGLWPINERLGVRVFHVSCADALPAVGSEHRAVRWCLPDELPGLDWLPADIAVAARLAEPAGHANSGIPRSPVAILNPVAKGYPRAVELLSAGAARRGWPMPVVLETSRQDFGGGQAESALSMGADLVIVGGGDGTVRAVAERLRGTGVEMAIIPLGTANIFARNLGLSPRRLEAAVEVAMDASGRPLDLGVARFRTAAVPTQASRDHLFLVLAGLGHDAETVLATRPDLKRRLGWAAYFESGVRHLVRPPVRMMIAVDGRPAHARAVWSFLVGNAGRIPLGIEIFPEARLDDGLLRTMEARATHLWQWIPVAWAGLRRRADSPVLVHGVARRLVIEPEEPTALQLDGDVFGPVVHLEIDVDPRALMVRCPESLRKDI